MMLQFIIDHNLGKPIAADGVLNTAITLRDRAPAGEEARLSRIYRDLLDRSGTGLAGEVVTCSWADLCARRSQIWHLDRRPIHALVEMSTEAPPEAIFRSFKVCGQGPAPRRSTETCGVVRNSTCLSRGQGSVLGGRALRSSASPAAAGWKTWDEPQPASPERWQ